MGIDVVDATSSESESLLRLPSYALADERPCAARERRAHRSESAVAILRRRGDVVGIGAEADAAELGEDGGSASPCVLLRLEH